MDQNVIKISPKMSIKIRSVINPIRLMVKWQKTKIRETIISIGSKILKFCIKFKKYTQMLKSEILAANFKTI